MSIFSLKYKLPQALYYRNRTWTEHEKNIHLLFMISLLSFPFNFTLCSCVPFHACLASALLGFYLLYKWVTRMKCCVSFWRNCIVILAAVTMQQNFVWAYYIFMWKSQCHFSNWKCLTQWHWAHFKCCATTATGHCVYTAAFCHPKQQPYGHEIIVPTNLHYKLPLFRDSMYVELYTWSFSFMTWC